jgi:hypothetical protein
MNFLCTQYNFILCILENLKLALFFHNYYSRALQYLFMNDDLLYYAHFYEVEYISVF